MHFQTTTVNFDYILDTRIDEGMVDLTCYCFFCFVLSYLILFL